MKELTGIFFTILSLFVLAACDPSFDTLICKKGVIKLVPHDNTSGSEVMYSSDYICGVTFDDESQYNENAKITDASNGRFQTINLYRYDVSQYKSTIPPQCSWLPSPDTSNFTDYDINQCGYNDCPNCVVVYCNDKDELTLSHKTCADYINNTDGAFTPQCLGRQ